MVERTAIEPQLAAKVGALHAILDQLGSVAVAFSAGVDSTLVLKVAHDRLGERAFAVIGKSPSLPPRELEDARSLSTEIGARLHEIETDELADPNYAANPQNRCFFCRTELYRHVVPFAEKHHAAVVDGLHAGDAVDWRPGATASNAAGVRHPLAEAGFDKADIRAYARELGLSNWNKPALACLSSRVPYGTPIDAPLLERIDRAEEGVRAAGFIACRVRAHGDVARIEVPPDQLADALRLRDQLTTACRNAGFQFAALDLMGYRTGALNEVR